MTSQTTGVQPDADQYLHKAKDAVITAEAPFHVLAPSELYIVWFAKVLGNWKALISTDVWSGAYWEVTYNGAKQETYVDAYGKKFNVAIPDAVEGCCGASEGCRDCPTD